MTEPAVYRVSGNRVEASAKAAGPWSPSLQHGGALAALVAWSAERIEAPFPMRVARLTLDLLRPTPLVPLELRIDVVRQGRKIQILSITLLANDVDVVRASVLKIVTRQTGLLEVERGLDVPEPMSAPEPRESPAVRSAFLDGISMRVARGSVREGGPAAIWFRADRPIIEGEESSPVMRAALTADFCNGSSAPLDPDEWTFVNADLSLSLARQPVGDWILLDAKTWMGPDGGGIASARLGDESGYFGRATQSLIIERR